MGKPGSYRDDSMVAGQPVNFHFEFNPWKELLQYILLKRHMMLIRQQMCWQENNHQGLLLLYPEKRKN